MRVQLRRAFAWVFLSAAFLPCVDGCSPGTPNAPEAAAGRDASSGGFASAAISGMAGAINVAGASGAFNQAGSFGWGGQAGTASGASGSAGSTGGSGRSGEAGTSGIGLGAGGLAGGGSGPGGGAGVGGVGGVAAQGGSAGLGDGLYCSPCVESSDCARGVYCVGGVNPRCGKACSADSECSVGNAASTCETLLIGGGATPAAAGAAVPSGVSVSPSAGLGVSSCTPADSVCGTAKTSARLSCTDTWASYANNFFATTCIGTCHRHDATFPSVEAVRPMADAIRLEVESGAMPQNATLSEPDRRRLLTWLACGAL
jgi:hypothetical protein